jgi:eukaryotic-like serine/threonine-protein kinase
VVRSLVVVSTPAAPRFVCPRCRTPYQTAARYCGECGADMQRASALEMAARNEGIGERELAELTSSSGGSGGVTHGAHADRRTSTANQAWLGKVVDSRYRVTELIGHGGMGVVYKVEHLRMGKVAAMKVLHPDLAEDPEVVRRFEQEATAVSRLNHPNTVQVFDFGAMSGALYLIMEYVRGQDLGAIVGRDGPMPWSRAAPLFFQTCGALIEAHDLGIVHRDLKPENVLVTRTTGGRDFAKVLDFGLAKLGARDQPPAAVTDKTEIVGTPYFMSPEQIRGDEVDARSDLYSLGALMYTVLTGEHVFTAKNAVGVLTKHLTAEVVPPSARLPEGALDPRVDALVLRALAKDAGDRWSSAAELAGEIEAAYVDLVGDLPMGSSSRSLRRRAASVADQPSSDTRLRREDLDAFERSLRRRKLVLAIGTVALVLAVAAAAGWWAFVRTPPPATREREPNQDLADATPIAFGTQVTGHLGARIGPREPDKDLYRVLGTDEQDRVVTVHVSGIRNLDLALTLRDGAGSIVATVDEGGLGAGEAIYRRRIRGGLVIEVDEVMRPDQPWAIENVSDAYTLVVDVDRKDGYEVEPDGTASDANPIGPGQTMTGWLEARADVDVLRWTGPAGPATITVTAGPELPIAWQVGDGPERRGPGSVEVELAAGAELKLSRADHDLPRGQNLPGEDEPWTVTVTPKK